MKQILIIAALALCGAAVFGQQAQPRLVVPPFENRGTNLSVVELENAQDFLINSFINTGRFQVPDRNALALLAEENKFQVSDWADEKKSAEMGKVLNADYIARVIVMHDGEVNLLMARILDVNTASGLSAEAMEFINQRDARGKMEDFVSGILQRIGGGVQQGGDQPTANTGKVYKIGDTGPGGGIVFQLEGNGGIEVSRPLGAYNFEAAINACKNYQGGGMNDWRLPSKEELNMVYVNLQKAGVVNLGTGDYWSSSQANNSDAWCQSFSSGGGQFNSGKNYTFSVRDVRAF